MNGHEAVSYGLLLPHFGSAASRARIVGGSATAERLGFDAVWVRDHLVYHPHGHDDPNATNLDSFVVLSAVAAVTQSISLGTATLIPHRHPIATAALMASVNFVAGEGRLVTAWGTGNDDAEFTAIGLGGVNRRELLLEQLDVIRNLLNQATVTHAGKYYQFQDVSISPRPSASHPIPIWFGGGSPAAVRTAVASGDGWIPGRMPLWVLRKRIDQLRELSAKAGKAPPSVGAIPYVSPGKSLADATARLNLPEIAAAIQHRYGARPAGADEFAGAVIAGSADAIVEAVAALHEVGVSHVVFDLRPRFEDWEECVHLLAADVLPKTRPRRGEASS